VAYAHPSARFHRVGGGAPHRSGHPPESRWTWTRRRTTRGTSPARRLELAVAAERCRLRRDIPDKKAFAKLLSDAGVTPKTTLVLYRRQQQLVTPRSPFGCCSCTGTPMRS